MKNQNHLGQERSLNPLNWGGANSINSRRLLRSLLNLSAPQYADARNDFLRESEVLQMDFGGNGVAFVAKNKNSGKVARYKSYFLPSQKAAFEREAKMLQAANIAGIGPRGKLVPTTDIIEMENIKGPTLSHMFKTENQDWATSSFSAVDYRKIIDAVSVQLLQQIERLHKLGIAHLDISSANVLLKGIKTENLEVFLLDFGSAHFFDELPELHNDPKVIFTTDKYGGRGVRHQKPIPADDYFSVGMILKVMAHEWGGSLNHKLQALSELMIASPQNPFSQPVILYSEMAKVAAQKNPTKEEDQWFWNSFKMQLEQSSKFDQDRLDWYLQKNLNADAA